METSDPDIPLSAQTRRLFFGARVGAVAAFLLAMAAASLIARPDPPPTAPSAMRAQAP